MSPKRKCSAGGPQPKKTKNELQPGNCSYINAKGAIKYVTIAEAVQQVADAVQAGANSIKSARAKIKQAENLGSSTEEFLANEQKLVKEFPDLLSNMIDVMVEARAAITPSEEESSETVKPRARLPCIVADGIRLAAQAAKQHRREQKEEKRMNRPLKPGTGPPPAVVRPVREQPAAEPRKKRKPTVPKCKPTVPKCKPTVPETPAIPAKQQPAEKLAESEAESRAESPPPVAETAAPDDELVPSVSPDFLEDCSPRYLFEISSFQRQFMFCSAINFESFSIFHKLFKNQKHFCVTC